ncbi:MAG: tetratricopeptide repeat protein [Nitrospirae bacterium]|nr:tetratricopeptide repeat protein [Candidatus Manganitrophaceae bacterium]
MFRRAFLFASFIPFLLLFFVRFGWAKGPSDAVSWSALEGETLQILKRYSSDPALAPAASLEQRIGFYLDAGLWSSAEQLLSGAPQREARPLIMKLYARQGRFGLVYAAYKKDPSPFLNDPALLVIAGEGALQQKAYVDVLTLLEPIPASSRYAPHRFYLSALALFALGDKAGFQAVMERWVRWGEAHPESPWSARAHLLNGYHQLAQKSYDLSFASLGQLFSENAYADLAMLGIGWAYFEMGSPENLLSILEGVEEGGTESRHSDQIFEILSRYQLHQGDLPGAIETGERAKAGLRRRIAQLENKADRIRRDEILPSPVFPPGSLLKAALLRLKQQIEREQQVGERQEVTPLLQRINLSLRQTALFLLQEEARAARKQEEKLTAELARRCMALQSAANAESQNPDPLYLQARAAALQGKKQEAEAALKQLLDAAPTGPTAEEATYRLGEFSFERGKYAEAIAYYRPLVDRPGSSLHLRSLYKTAWSHYRLGHPKEVIPLALQLWLPSQSPVELGETPCRSATTPEERQEYLRLLALALRSDGGAARLIHWLRGNASSNAFSLVSDMAIYQKTEGEKKEALQLIQAWVSAYPLYAETPLLHRTLIDLYNEPSLASSPEALQARISFIENYRPDAAWAKENSPERIEAVKPLLKEQIRFLMTHFHGEAKKAQRAALYQKVLPWYDLYLQLFPAEKETGEIDFLYAELLGEMKEERRAAARYRASAYVDPPHPLAAEAAYREVLILERLFHSTDPDLWEGYARFIQGFPSDSRISQIYLKQAERAFQERDYDKSRQFAEAVAMEEGAHDCAKETQRDCIVWIAAQKLIVQGYLNAKEYPKAIKQIKELLYRSTEKELPLPEKETTALQNLLVLSYYQQGESLKQQGRLLEAAGSFSDSYRENNQNELSPLALFEAASLWKAGGEQAKAEKAFAAFTADYPKSALYHPALLQLASLYEETERPEEAAEIYEAAGRQRNDPAFSLQALDQALALYERMEAWEKVALVASEWVERSQGNKERQIDGMVRGAEAKLNLGDEKAAEKMLGDAIRLSAQRTPPKKSARPGQDAPSFYLAKAHLLLADIEIKRYEEINLVAPLEKNLHRKKVLFDRLLHDYGEASGYPSPVLALAATHRLGEVFEEFSRALLQSERPRKLSQEERQAYDRLLTEQALPYLQKAEEAYRQNIDWAKKAGIESEWVEKSRERFQQIHQQIESSRSGAQEALFR